MKILVYEADEIVPIEGLYEWLGDSGRVIFSNAETEIQNFEREVRRLLEIINFDAVIFYIPLSIQNQFVKLVNQQFHLNEWQEDNTVKFSIDDIGLFGNGALSRFFSQMRLIVGLTPKVLQKTD
jgi:predicted site-specific integrase-resolvase